MLRQIRYFQSVVQNNSFSEAAEECHISQSAISQQIKALENELGFQLLERKSRKFVLTPAGEHFYKKSLVLVADYEQMCRESAKIARGDDAALRIGYLRSYSGREVQLALEEFTEKYPGISVQLMYGNHEELFRLLRTEDTDLVLNDQRRAFSDEYVNLVLTTSSMYAEISARNPMAALPSVAPQELKNIPCILVASREQRDRTGLLQDSRRFPGGISVCGKSGGSPSAGDQRSGFYACGRRQSDDESRYFDLPDSALPRERADHPEVLSVLEKGQFRLLYRRICRDAEEQICIMAARGLTKAG